MEENEATSSSKGLVVDSGAGAAAAQKGASHLLAIGINEYAAPFTKLKNAVKDVRDVAALLAARFGFDPQPPFTRFLLDAEATRRGIIHALENLCDLQPDDRALIFYSGHGYLNPRTKHGFWIPADAEKDDVASYLPNTTLRDYVKAMPCRHILLVSDSCFSGDLLVRDATRKAEGAFADWEKQRSRWIFCSGKGVVGDGEAGKNSPFAAELLRSLRDHKTAEPLNAARLADQVTRQVSYNYEQQAEACPLFGVGHQGGQFIFYPQKNEADDWLAALAAGEVAAFENFLKNHPASQLAAEARQRLEALHETERQRQRRQAHDEAYRRAKQAPPTIDVLEDFLEKHPASPHKAEIRSLLKDAEADEAWRRVPKNSVAALDEYLEENPYGKYAAEARRRIGEIRAARRQSEAEKQAAADLAVEQAAAERQDELRKKKEDEESRSQEAEEARQQREAAILKQQQEDTRLHREAENRRQQEERRKKQQEAPRRPAPTSPPPKPFPLRWAALGAAGLLALVLVVWLATKPTPDRSLPTDPTEQASPPALTESEAYSQTSTLPGCRFFLEKFSASSRKTDVEKMLKNLENELADHLHNARLYEGTDNQAACGVLKDALAIEPGNAEALRLGKRLKCSF